MTTRAATRTPARGVSRAAGLLGQARRAVVLTGAGISTPSGLPDFRSPASGLWNNVDHHAVASLDGFCRNPQAFYQWIRPLAQRILVAEPNPAHLALAELEADGRLQAVITQNIDLLHTRAGSRRVLELHGHIRTATCMGCGQPRPAEPLLRRFIQDGQTPRCPDCGGVLKPNVVLFGENLPAGLFEEAQRLACRCDVMLIAGSSLEVWPVSDLPRQARVCGARLIIVNHEPTPFDGEAEVVIHGDVAEVLPAIAAEIAAPAGLAETRHAAG